MSFLPFTIEQTAKIHFHKNSVIMEWNTKLLVARASRRKTFTTFA
jgi:hypothetical protein